MALDLSRYNPTLGPTGQRIVNLVNTYYPKSSELYVTSAYREFEADGGQWSHHNGQNYNGSPTAAVDFGARDFGYDEGNRRMRDLAKWLYDNFGDLTVEMFHTTPYADDSGFNIRNQQPTGDIAEHGDHIHYATSAALLDLMEARAKAKWGAGGGGGGTPAPVPTQSTIPPGSLVLDYAFGKKPSYEAMRAGGVRAVSRYLSQVNSATRPKILTEGEALGLSQNGIAVISNFEWYPERSVEGFSAGAEDARVAVAQARDAGMPSGRPIYFSVDEDVSPDEVYSYFDGIASVLPVSQIGAYGSYRVIKALRDAGKIGWSWQTYAWSNGQWDPRNHFEQYKNSQNFDGADVDFNRTKTTDFGQWFHRSIASEGEEMSAETERMVWNADRWGSALVDDLDEAYIKFSPSDERNVPNKLKERLIRLEEKLDALAAVEPPTELDYEKLAKALLKAAAEQ